MLHTAPSDLYKKLEFDKVLHLLEELCLGELGAEAVRQMPISILEKDIHRQLREVDEYKNILQHNQPFPFQPYEGLEEEITQLAIEDFVLNEEGYRKIAIVLLGIQSILRFFTPERKEIFPRLYDIVKHVTFDETLIVGINKVFTKEGDIRPDASPELQKISKLINNRQRELDKVFRDMVNKYRTQGFLTDNVESFRNGRRVLSVPSEHKRKVRGIIHDESTTGKTAFIEPEGVIDINNDIFDLFTERKKEIYKILKDLSSLLRPHAPYFDVYVSLLVRFDMIQAKARLGAKMNGVVPKVVNEPHLGIQMGFHPLLLLKNKLVKKETVPFDLTLFGKNRLLVLSGPNAGGKSVTMKSVGLLQLMVQSGMLVPVDETSQFGIFKQIFADIGDQQSLDDDLSTYSSHLANMRVFLEKANKDTLVLIDEFGSGTDPKIGGGIAEAILHELHHKKVSGVITTHYSNLKIFAFQTPGLVNGSMIFDKANLAPTYELKVGRPGSSFAFEIAQKSGLSESILKYARHKVGKNEKAVDDLLIDLQSERKELEDKLQSLEDKQKNLDRLIKSYESMQRDFEFRRKKLKLDIKEAALQQVSKENREVENLVRELRETKKLEDAKELAQKVKESRAQLAEEVSLLQDTVNEIAPSKKSGEIVVGAFVKMRNGGATGQVESIDKNKAVVLMNSLRMTIALRDLEAINEPLVINARRSVQTDLSNNDNPFESKIDIRGMRFEDAIKILEAFVDSALLNDTRYLRILHGKGSGALRNAVKNKLREYRNLTKVYHPPQEQGGDGVTLIEV